MKKRIDILVSSCSNCPYCIYDPSYNCSRNSGYECQHEDGEVERIVDDWEVSNSNNKSPKGWPPIPSGCPLPDAVEGE